MARLNDIVDHTNRMLGCDRIGDYAPNGLQVAGRARVKRLVSGVSACQRLLDAACAAEADALLVHHGWFWRGEDPCLSGMKLRRIRTLIDAGLSLLAYHLPLDVHPEIGNNALLGKRLGIHVEGRTAAQGVDGLLWYGQLASPTDSALWLQGLGELLQRPVLAVGGPPEGPAVVQRIAWCSGAAQGLLLEAAGLGVDAYISGEISERTTHEARESGVLYVSAGHHATERLGVQALGEHIAREFGLEHRFIDIDNPV